MAHAKKLDFVFRRNGRVLLNQRVGGVSSVDYCAAEVCSSALVMLDTPCSEVVWSVLATHYFRQFLLHFPSRASPCAITFQLEPTTTLLRSPVQEFSLVLLFNVGSGNISPPIFAFELLTAFGKCTTPFPRCNLYITDLVKDCQALLLRICSKH